MADTIITIGGETTQLERDIQKALSQDFKLKGFDAKSFSQPLGKIKGDLGEFEKSLEASNARVVAFGASAGAIYLLTDAFKTVVSSTIEVEKSLADINSVLNASGSEIKSFGNSLFDAANKTSSSFETASQAALEFSRQGLTLQETIKRTTDALTLAKLSGLSAADSVDALTAAANSFNNSGLTTAQIVNKLAAVDARYAVSSADLAEAIKRVGSSAREAGVGIDQLIGLVTSAQQTTARGGSVIGNSFKTIFTRLQRPKVLDDLKEIGIQTTNSYGETLPLIQILTQLASTYDRLGSSQKAQIAELIGGVYQVNILKATLGDLSKQYSIYNGAVTASASATNEAEVRIGKLGETLDSQINRVTNNIKRAGSVVGELTLAPALERVLTGVNGVLETFALGKEPEGFGEKAAQGFLKGLGSFIAGPGLLIAAVGAYKIFQRLAVFVGDAARTILDLGSAAKQQAQIQAQILQMLQRNPQLYKQIESGAISVESAAQGYLTILRATNDQLERQKILASEIAAVSMQSMVGGAIPTKRKGTKGKAAGYLPNFAGGVSSMDTIREISAAANHKSGYSIGANDVYKTTIHDGNGGRQEAIVNKKEKVKTVRNSAGFLATSVIPPNGFAGGYFATGLSLAQYAFNKGKTVQGFKAPALNAAYEAGVPENEIKAAFPNWSYKGATTSLKEKRISAAYARKAAYEQEYNFKKVIFPWNKNLSDFGGDTNLMGDAYEAEVMKKYGVGNKEGRLYSATSLGLHGSTEKDKNFTDVDFVLFNRKVDINNKKDVAEALSSNVRLLIEAKGGEYKPGDVAKKFPRALKNNPFLAKNKGMKNLLLSTYGNGYLPNFGKGSKLRRRERRKLAQASSIASTSARVAAPTAVSATPAVNPVFGRSPLKLAPKFTPEEQAYQAVKAAKVPIYHRVNQSIPNVTTQLPPITNYKDYTTSAFKPLKLAPRVLNKPTLPQQNINANKEFAQPSAGGQGRSAWKKIVASSLFSMAPAMLESFGVPLRNKDTGEQTGLGKAVDIASTVGSIASMSDLVMPKSSTMISKGLGKISAPFEKAGESMTKLATSLSKNIPILNKATPAFNLLGKGVSKLPIVGLATAGYAGFTGMKEKQKYGADAYESFVLEGLPAIASVLGGIAGGAAGSIAGPLGTVGGAAGGSYALQKAFSKLGELSIGKDRAAQLKSNQELTKAIEEDTKKYKGNDIALLGVQARQAKEMTLSQGMFEGSQKFEERIKAASDEALQARNAQVAQIIAKIGTFDMQKLQEQGASREDISKLLSQRNIQTGGNKESAISGVLGAINEGRRAEEAGRKMQYLNTVLSDLTAQAGYTAVVLERVKNKETERTKLMAQNLGGGVAGFEKPSEVGDSLIKIRESLDVLNDPRLNIIDKGRAARRYKEGMSELGVYESLPEQKRRRIEALQASGLQYSNAQNLYQLNRMTSGVGGFGADIYGATYGKKGAIAAARKQAGLTRLTTAEYQLSQNDSSYYTSEEFRIKNLNPARRESLGGAENKLRNFADFLNKLSQASVNSPVARNYLENQVMPMVSNAQVSASNDFSRTGSINETIAAFSKIMESLPSDVSEAINNVASKGGINVNNNVTIGLTETAEEYLNVAKELSGGKGKSNGKEKGPPKKM